MKLKLLITSLLLVLGLFQAAAAIQEPEMRHADKTKACGRAFGSVNRPVHKLRPETVKDSRQEVRAGVDKQTEPNTLR